MVKLKNLCGKKSQIGRARVGRRVVKIQQSEYPPGLIPYPLPYIPLPLWVYTLPPMGIFRIGAVSDYFGAGRGMVA